MRKKVALNALLAGTLALTLGTATAEDKTIKIGWTAWSDAEFVTKLAAKILEDRLGLETELVQTDIAPQYQGIATGDIDVMLMSWQPTTHEDYVKKVGDKGFDLGLLYTNAKLGWVVPAYVPVEQVKTIDDLKKPEVREKLDATVTGIDPGAGLTRLSQQAIDDYELDYELQISSGAGMTAALERAIRRNEWIAVTGWSPHWMFGAYDLRYLEDPKGVLGKAERVHAYAHNGFYQDHIEAASFLSRMQIPVEELQASMYKAQETSYEEAVDDYIQAHPERVDYWVTGEL
jgi:glycine betaine/proline transport system substrate-binding protein